MSQALKLTIATPLAVVIDADDVTYLRAEDDTGAFGILPGHADFLTTLVVSVVTWRRGETTHNVAVRGGVLTAEKGSRVSIVTPEAVGEETLAALGDAVLDKLRAEKESQEASRLAGTRMELAALRQLERYLATGSTRFHQDGGSPRMPDTSRPDTMSGVAEE